MSLNEHLRHLRQFPQSCDKHMTQTVSKMASMIDFGIRNQGQKFRPSDVFEKVAFDEETFRQSDHLTKTLDEVS